MFRKLTHSKITPLTLASSTLSSKIHRLRNRQIALLDSNNATYNINSLSPSLEQGSINDKSEYSIIEVSIKQHIEQIKKNNKDISALVEIPVKNKSDQSYLTIYNNLNISWVGSIIGTLLIECFTAGVFKNKNLIQAVLLNSKNTDSSRFNDKQYDLAMNLIFNLEFSKLFIHHDKFEQITMKNPVVLNRFKKEFCSWAEHARYREQWLNDATNKIEALYKSQCPWRKTTKLIYKLVKK